MKFSQNIFSEALNRLQAGSLAVLQTDTLYALSCDASNESAIKKVFSLKKRQENKSLPILVYDLEQAEIYAKFNELAYKLAENFWPGALTLILPSQNKLPEIIQGLSDNIAIRVPNSAFILELIKALGSPIIGTSANISGKMDLLQADDIRKHFYDESLLILSADSESNTFGNSSTIVDCTDGELRVVRQGAISGEKLEQVAAGSR